VVLAASLPGLTNRRALTLNLSGSAVSNVLPLGGVAGTVLNLGMVRGWGHSDLDFARFVVVSRACDVVAKLLMPVLAVSVLALWGPAVAGPHVAVWSVAAVVSAAATALVVNALSGRAAAAPGRRGARALAGRTLVVRDAPIGDASTRWTAMVATSSTAPTGWSGCAGRR
jgi:hypothetical protein